jgi:PAS domain S-box-containing protein
MPEMDQLFRSFSDAMPFGACLVDLQGRIIYWNMAAEEITGYRGHDVLGRAYRGDLLIHCEGRNGCAEVQCPVTDVLRDGRAVMADLFLRHKDGHRIPVRVSAFSLRDSKGEIRGVGEIFNPTHGEQENHHGWVGHSEREFEMATGLPAVEESREQVQTLLHCRKTPSTALILIEMSEQQAILQHGGTAMLHQAVRVVAKTIAALLPPRNYVGCWSDGRLIAIIPECKPEILEQLKSTLASVGSSCAVKWWGDRVVVGIRAAANYVNSSQTVDALIQDLERDLKGTTATKA